MCPDFANQALAASLTVKPESTLRAEADRASMTRGGVSHLQGNVRARQLDRLLEANELYYNQRTGTAYTQGRVYFQNPQIGVHGRNARFNLQNDSGTVEDAHYTLPKRNARGRARHVHMLDKNRSVLRHVTYTTCPPGETSWLLSASTVSLNQADDVGTATNALVRFKGVPILYSPWLTFPISNKRKSGLLTPTIGTSSNSGLDLTIPYYLNLAPNYDATIAGRYMSRRGVEGSAQFRYLEPHSHGTLYLEYLPHDNVYGDSRHLVQFDHQGLLSPSWSVDARYERVSDKHYFQDLGTNLGAISTSSLEQRLQFNYQAPSWFSFQALAQGYQTLEDIPAQDKPYKRLPQLSFDVLSPHTWHGFGFKMTTQYVDFTREVGPTGERINIQPGLTYQLDHGGWFVDSEVDYDQTDYRLRDITAGQPRTPSRGLPIASLKSGLRFQRNLGSKWVQTLEPTVFYLYVPYRNQADLPAFDTGLPEFNYYELFARNRFTGLDRIGDANQVTTALTTRLLNAETGREKLSASIGQIHRFTLPRVTLPATALTPLATGDVAQNRHHSDWVGMVDYHVTDAWSTRALAEWDPYTNGFNRNLLQLRYRPQGSNALLNLSYRYSRDYLEQATISGVLPLSRHWQVLGSWNYSLRYRDTFEALAGLEYDTCCYAVRLAYRRYVVSPRSGQVGIQHNSSIFFQLQLKGLGNLGNNMGAVLKRDILGY